MAPKASIKIANRARRFRKELTEPEVMLWSRLKGRGRDQPIFRRQVAIGSIIVDFYCPAARLAVEVDGRTHWDDEAQARDEARDFWLAQQGISVARVGAGEVYRNLGQVVDGIVLRAEELIARG
jgi:very-short-patch-repair endonuclease